MSGQLGDLVISLSADIARFRDDMGKAVKVSQDSTAQMVKSLDAIPAAFGTIGKAAAGVTAILGGGAMFKDMISTTKEVTGEVVKLSKVFGISAEEASVLRVALDDALLTTDDAVAASDRLTRASLKNADAFKRAGIDIKDSDGHLKSSLTVMMEVNDYLKTLKEGKDRDTAAMALYGKGWRELSGILRLTSEGMKEAKDRAERLHLIFGDEGLRQVKEYKLAMKDLDDVAESFKVTIGRSLIPLLTDLSVEFGEAGASAADEFASSLKESIRFVKDWETEILHVVNKIGIRMNGGPLGSNWFTKSGRAEIQAELDAEDKMYDWRMQKNAEKWGDNVKARSRKGGATGNAPDMAQDKEATLWSSAHEKYLAYEKAYAERMRAIVKTEAEQQLEVNRVAYELGLTTLQAYLDKKHSLSEKEIEDEIKIAKGELAKYTAEVTKWKSDTSAKGANNYHDSLTKQEEAKKRLIELEGKLKVTRSQDDYETEKALHDQNKELVDMSAQVMELAGHYWQAAEARQVFYKASPEYKKLTDSQREEKDALMSEELRSAGWKDTSREQQRASFLNDMDISAGGSSKFNRFTTEKQRLEIEAQYQSRLKTAEDYYKNDASLAEEWGKAKEKAETERAQRIAALERSEWTGRMDFIGDSMGRMSNILMQGNKDQFEAGKALAIASATVNTISAGIAAFTGITESTGGWGVAAGIAEMAVVIATGMAQIATISSTQYQPRAMGGPVNSGRSYLVGENGPELLTMGPGQNGAIIPNGQLRGSGDVNVTHVWQVSTGVPDTVRAELAGYMPLIEARSIAAVQSAIESGSNLSRSVGRMR